MQNQTHQVNRPGGIVFYSTRMLNTLEDFYTQKTGCSVWLRQKDCSIFKFSNMLFGFCQREKADLCSMITFFYPDKEHVNKMYELFKKEATNPPKLNEKYEIYHFFATDPEERTLEFQYFLKPMRPF